MIRYTITAIKKSGLRELAFDNNHLRNYVTKEEADQHLADVISANTARTILEIVGADLRVEPVECYSSGDATRTVF